MFNNITRFVAKLFTKQEIKAIYSIPSGEKSKIFMGELINHINTRMSKKHAGFRSSYGGKGIREGLIIGKQAIKSATKYCVGYENYREYGDDEIRLKLHLISLLKKEKKAKYKPFKTNLANLVKSYNFNIFKIEENESDDSNIITFYETNQLTMVRFNYYNQLKKSLQTQIHFSFAYLSSEEKSICLEYFEQCFTQTYQSFMQTTCYKPIENKEMFFTQADLAIQQQISSLNGLPGDEGTYELVGLHGVRDYLHSFKQEKEGDTNVITPS